MQIDPVLPRTTPPCLAQRKELVLLVDDEPFLGEMMRQGMSRQGIDASVAVSSAEPLDLALSS